MAGFCRVECLETRGTVAGRSLHGMTRDEPCSCSISCRINSVYRINCWIACGNTVVLVVLVLFVETPLYSVLEDRLKNLSLDLLSPLLWK